MTGVEAVEVLHQLLPLKIMACCYDNKNTNTAWPTIPVKNLKYPKVASSRPVYYSIFDYFWGATNRDVLPTETCYYCHVQQSIKLIHFNIC